MHQLKRSTRVLAGLSVVALVAVASCGDDDSATTKTTTAESVKTATTTPSSGAETTTGSSTETTGSSTPSSGSSETTEATEGSTPARETGPGERHVDKDEGKPVKGGTLRYGLEADSANGWAPYRTSCATSCYIPLETVSDSLFAVSDKDGQPVPLLVESVDHNADYTEWTLKIRDGIKFHDGTPLDGAAVKFNVDSCRASALVGSAYAPIGSVTADGQTVTLTMQGGPWVALPAYFSIGQCGYMFSQQWLSSLQDIPQRSDKSPVYDATLAATPADGDPAKPIGLGAFKFDSYTPGNGNTFKAVRNDDYWRGPNGITGEDLPYLDAIEATVFVDIDSRANALRSGQLDAFHTANSDAASQFLDDDSFEVTATDRFGDTNYILLNVAQGTQDPESKNAKSPLINVDCRRALAFAIDNQRLSEERGAGLVRVANGPFPPGSAGFVKDTGYPQYEPDQANAEMDKCLSALGTDKLEFTFNTTNDPFNIESNTLITSMWTDVFGDRVKATITPIEQGQYIGLALTGAFQAQGWRNHAGSDPDQQRIWWQTASAQPLGGLALDFGRISDPDMDKQLDVLKTNPDPAARKAAAEAINKIFGQKAYNWWNSWTLWAIITQPYVNGIEAHALPDGSKGIGLAFAGRHQVNQIWCDGGNCGG